MIQELKEEIISDFKGTIIDIETIGEFNGRYRNSGDWREYEAAIVIQNSLIKGIGNFI